MSSCLDNDDNNEVEIDEEWKALNDTRYSQIASDGSYNVLSSQSGNGKVYWKTSTVITDSDQKPDLQLRTTVEGKPEFTDTVVVRYEGWYIDKEGEKRIFDSTENISIISEINYRHGIKPDPSPNKIPSTFAVNPSTSGTAANNYISGVIDGFSTALQDMKLNEERDVCMPYQLAYGTRANTYTPSNGSVTYTIIPAYTTLWFRIKLLKIIPMKA